MDLQNLEFYCDYLCPIEDVQKFINGDKSRDEFDFDGRMINLVGLEITKALVKKYPNLKIDLNNTREINTYCCCPAYGVCTFVIKNPSNGKYMIISYCDKAFCISEGELVDIPETHELYKFKGKWGWKLKDCVKVFQAFGVHQEDVTYTEAALPFSYTPCTHMVFDVDSYFEVEKSWQNPKTIPQKPFFRGHGSTPFRVYIEKDQRFQVERQRIAAKEFVKEMARDSIIIDINSIAEISCRTLEGMGLGSAVIRPKLLIQYHNKLIPNYHYAAVDCDDIGDFKKLADAYIAKFEELKANPELVKFYGENGRKWYEQNCKIESYVDIFVNELINLNDIGITI